MVQHHREHLAREWRAERRADRRAMAAAMFDIRLTLESDGMSKDDIDALMTELVDMKGWQSISLSATRAGNEDD